MEPTLKDGDRILVNKMINGARLFDVFAVLNNEDVVIHRTPGLGNFKRNDIQVFNFPYQMNRWDSVRFDVMQYYVKRCIVLPGDTLEIRGGFYKIRGCDEQLGNYSAQHDLANLDHPEQYGIVVSTDEPYKLSFVQIVDRVGTEEETTYKRRTNIAGRQCDYLVSL